MLINAKQMMIDAKDGHYAIPHFNINNLEWTRYILEECQELDEPVILGVSEGAVKYMGGYVTVANIVRGLMQDLDITIPVVLHLDHGTYEGCFKAIDAGFTSVMYDGSRLPLDQNIANTKEVVNYAKDKDISVEAEIGAIGVAKDNLDNEDIYTKVEDAVKMKETGIDFLAPALGSVHGIYKGEPKLDFTRMEEIKEATGLPLVLHGGSGIPDDMIRHAIDCGVTKLNVNTDLQIAWTKGVRELLNLDEEVYDPRKVIGAGKANLQQVVKDKVELLRNK
jgi:fructose-bisphosphate aldolase, class II